MAPQQVWSGSFCHTPSATLRNMTTMAPVQDISTTAIKAMLTTAAVSAGLTYEQFVEAGRADALTDPELRDLWLIWGPDKPE